MLRWASIIKPAAYASKCRHESSSNVGTQLVEVLISVAFSDLKPPALKFGDMIHGIDTESARW